MNSTENISVETKYQEYNAVGEYMYKKKRHIIRIKQESRLASLTTGGGRSWASSRRPARAAI